MRFLELLWGTVIYRPYVYVFLFCFLIFAFYHLKWKTTLFYLLFTYCISFACEYSSTRNGFPFGMYVYHDRTRTRELWISNVPFWDSLSFVFLSYFSWILAASLRSPKAPEKTLFQFRTAFLSGLLMMTLDLVIDPLTLLGDRWFLGSIYHYANEGSYFGVTLANFLGWFILGTAIPLLFSFLSQKGLKRFFGCENWRPISRQMVLGVYGVYAGIFIFNLGITIWIREWALLTASSVIVSLTLGLSAIVLFGSFRQVETTKIQ